MTDDPRHGDDVHDDDELAELAELRAIGRRVGDDPVAWEQPPDDLWARIEADVDALPGSTPDVMPDTAPTSAPAVVPLPSRPTRRVMPWLAAAAAIVVLVAGVAIWRADSSDPLVVAQTQLELLGDTGEGSAELVERDGTFRLNVATSGIDTGDDAFAEVWMISPDVTAMISLGPLRPDGVYDLPAGFDPTAFPIVDISIEPLNGDPTHSGNSVLRGQLTF